MDKVSIRQPVVLYSLVFTLIIAFAVVMISTSELIDASHRAYRRAIEHDLKALAGGSSSLAAIRTRIAERPMRTDVDTAIVTSSISAFGLDLFSARRLAAHPSERGAFVVVRVAVTGTVTPGSLLWRPVSSEAYLVGAIDPAIPRSIALSGTASMIPMVMIGALACAAVLAFMLGRLLLPPLTQLKELAKETRVEPDGFVASDAPNEILEVAHRFRRTVRMLNEERELIEEQKIELERMQASLIRASKLASVGRLAAGIAHEIGNPLAAVQGYLGLFDSGLDEEEQRDVLKRCSSELARISETIRKLLTYARGGEEASEPVSAISTGRVLAETLALALGHPTLRQVEIQNEVKSSDQPDAVGHAGRLNQVIVNILLNAGQALKDIDEPLIRITRSLLPDAVEIIVENNGPGIPTEDLERIFDPFYTTKDPGEGTGLGLAVSRSLMEAMEGDLLADSTENGVRFRVRLRAKT